MAERQREVAESNGQQEVEIPLEDLVPVEIENETAPTGPEIRGAVTIKLMTDGNYNIEMLGVTQLEVPSLLRVAANRVEKELGIR